MRIACVSDMHGNLDFNIEKCDILLCAGDSFPYYKRNRNLECIAQNEFIKNSFIPWIEKQPCEHCVFISGNHDWIFEWTPCLVPSFPSNIHYLQDEEIEIDGIRIYGTPQQPIFYNWAFNKNYEQLEEYFSMIPEGLDILLSHTAPFGIMDEVNFPNRKGNFGCKILRKRIEEINPKYVVFGHFHNCYGIQKNKEIENITFVNASLLNENYEMTKKPLYIEM